MDSSDAKKGYIEPNYKSCGVESSVCIRVFSGYSSVFAGLKTQHLNIFGQFGPLTAVKLTATEI